DAVLSGRELTRRRESPPAPIDCVSERTPGLTPSREQTSEASVPNLDRAPAAHALVLPLRSNRVALIRHGARIALPLPQQLSFVGQPVHAGTEAFSSSGARALHLQPTASL